MAVLSQKSELLTDPSPVHPVILSKKTAIEG